MIKLWSQFSFVFTGHLEKLIMSKKTSGEKKEEYKNVMTKVCHQLQIIYNHY